MTLFGLIITIALVGLLIWAITTLVPMPDNFKKAIYVISIVFLVFYVLNAIGVLGSIPNPRIN